MTLFYLSIRIHFGQITSNQMLVPVIEKLKETTISKVREVRVSVLVDTGVGRESWRACDWEVAWRAAPCLGRCDQAHVCVQVRYSRELEE